MGIFKRKPKIDVVPRAEFDILVKEMALSVRREESARREALEELKVSAFTRVNQEARGRNASCNTLEGRLKKLEDAVGKLMDDCGFEWQPGQRGDGEWRKISSDLV